MFIDINNLLEKLNSNNKINYDLILKETIKNWQTINKKPKLLIHSCCAPCSTYVLEYLANYSDITIYFANSNIHPKIEYERRSRVQKMFIHNFNNKTGHNIQFLEAPYKPAEFIKSLKHLRNEPEGGMRCHFCYKMRLDLSASKAKELNFDYFASALTLSPKKNSQKINELGIEIQKSFNIKYLPSDFKKNNGYKRSIEICKEYNVYRQCYCGCVFAAQEQGIDLKKISENAKIAIQSL